MITVKTLYFLYNYLMTEKDELETLIEEFLSYCQQSGRFEKGSASLSFDTRISTWEREETEAIIRAFIAFTQGEGPEDEIPDDWEFGL